MSWSRDCRVADAFARGQWRTWTGGSVVETCAPPEAVICVIPKRADIAKEREVLLDRRRLAAVRVVHRYGVSPEELDAEMKQAESSGGA